MMTPFEKAIQHESAGEYGKAFELFRRCLDEEGHDKGDIYFRCGWCLENDRDGDRSQTVYFYEKASREAEAVLVRVNGSFRAGWVLLQEKDLEPAASAFRRAVDLAEQANLDHALYHHAMFWSAMCMEYEGRYLEAAHQYGRVQRLSPALVPESCYRVIVCCNKVGKYEEALEACRAFPSLPPDGCDPRRFTELSAQVKREESLLTCCLSDGKLISERA